MDWTLELICVPVSDVERAKVFYAEKLGFIVDFDGEFGGERAVQLTPKGSGCSICIGIGLTKMKPGTLQDVQLVVRDLKAARKELVDRGVTVSEIQVYERDGSKHLARGDEDLNNVGFVFLNDPDGNGWAIQQINDRK